MATQSIPQEIYNNAFVEFANTLSPELKQRLNGRLERGLGIAKSGGVSPDLDPANPVPQRYYKVVSSNFNNAPYLVDLQSRTCTCPDHWKGHFCKHRIAANIFRIALRKMDESKLASKPQAVREAPKVSPAEDALPSTPVVAPTITLDIQVPNGEAVIWACIKHDGKNLGVEVLSFDSEKAVIKALPIIKDNTKLQPQFPFAEGKSAVNTIPSKDLFHVRVFRRA